MELRHEAEFELINNSLWLLLKRYIKDVGPYKQIMSDLFYVFMRKDLAKDKFSEEWKDSLIEFYDVPERYRKSQDACGFGVELAECLQRYLEYQEHHGASYEDFYRFVSKAYLIEWERLKDEATKTQNTERSQNSSRQDI